MKEKILAILAVVLCLSAYVAAVSMADKITFNTGGSIEGIIQKEGGDVIEIDVGFGTVTCMKDQISRIYRSTPEELFAIRDNWEKKKEELAAQEGEFAKDRERRFAEYEKWTQEESEKKKDSPDEAKEIQISRDGNSQNLLVEVLLNNQVKSTLVLDTGATLVVLSKRIGEELGVDFSDKTKDIVKLHLADNRNIDAKLVMLDSVRIKDVEVKDVMAAIPVEDIGQVGSKDGLLGMSFLGRFNLKIDLANMKMVLEKIKR